MAGTTPSTAEATPTPSRLLRGDAVLSNPLVLELLEARLIGVLATTQPGGAIHAVPMWFARHEDAVLLATSSASRKIANLELDDRATLVVHDSRQGTEVCGVSIRGRMVVVRAPDAAALVQLVHLRYVTPAGLELPEARAFLGGDDVALRLTPESAFTWDERGNPATAALRAAGGALPLEPTSSR
jgi:nitroimidazol reductase NimA-like FMN-containing flavoprotein (pyridoxamine 5'-phosphate oxidase superfamily)